MPKIKLRGGLEANLPVLDEREPAFTTDTEKLFIGSKDGNIDFAKQSDLSTTNANVATNTANIASNTATLNSIGTINANAELVAARGTYPTLAPRLDNVDLSLTDRTADLQNRGINVMHPPAPLVAAKGTGTDDDTSAIQAALTNYKYVFLPKQHLIRGSLQPTSDSVIFGDGKNSELLFDSPSYDIRIDGVQNVKLTGFKCSKFADGCIKIKNNASNIRIEHLKFASTYQDYMFGTCIKLQGCSDVTIDSCTFTKTGYQVLQDAGFVSNDVIIQNCISYSCNNDFVEMNCENTSISRNWIIRNNRVYNVGMYQKTSETTTFGYTVYHTTNNLITSANTEGRFVGMTWCDNVLIEGNIVENVGGDSAIHIEEPMNVTIKDNIIKNAHSQSGRFVWSLMNGAIPTDNTLQNYNVPKGEQKLTVKDNTFIIDNGVKLTNDVDVFILLAGENRSNGNAFTDFGTNNNFIIEGNKFLNYDPIPTVAPYTTGYPRIPATKYGTAINLIYCYSNVYIEKNTFQGLNYGMILSPGRQNSNIFGSFIDKNKFNSCATAVYVDEHAIWSFQNNSFTNCGTALTYTNKAYSFLQRVEGNHFYNTPVVGLNTLQSAQRKNKYISSTNDDYTDSKVYTAATTSVNLAVLPKSIEQQFRGTLIVSAKSNITGTDKYTTNVYNIEYFYSSSNTYVGSLSLINQNAGSTKVTALSASLDLTNGYLTIAVTSSENYELSCAVMGY